MKWPRHRRRVRIPFRIWHNLAEPARAPEGGKVNRRFIFAMFLLLPLVVALTGGCACVGGRYHHGAGHACVITCAKDCCGAGKACCAMHRSSGCAQMGACCKGQGQMCGQASTQGACATQMSCGSKAPCGTPAACGSKAACGTKASCGSRASCGSKAECSPAGCNKPDCCKKGAWDKHRSGCPLPPDQCWGYCRSSVSKAGAEVSGCNPASCKTPCTPQRAQIRTPGCSPSCGAKK